MAKPAVGAGIPGVRAIIEHEANGLVVPPRDAGSLARAIDRLLRDDALRAAYGQAARAKAEQDFDDRRVAEWFVQEYRTLWAAKRGSGC